MPTNRRAKKALLALIPPLKEGVIFELGSGFGTLAFSLAKQFPQKTVIGYEISPVPYFFSLITVKLLKINNLHFIRRDFLACSLENAALCVCYLSPKGMNQLERKFALELTDHAFVISNTFAFPKWTPERVSQVADLYHSKIFLYRKLL